MKNNIGLVLATIIVYMHLSLWIKFRHLVSKKGDSRHIPYLKGLLEYGQGQLNGACRPHGCSPAWVTALDSMSLLARRTDFWI